jgi:hypothetical protein
LTTAQAVDPLPLEKIIPCLMEKRKFWIKNIQSYFIRNLVTGDILINKIELDKKKHIFVGKSFKKHSAFFKP